MRILFFGIYEIGVMALSELLERGAEIAAVVTKPASPPDEQPVAGWAASRGMPVYQPSTPSDPGFIAEVEQIRPDLLVVAGYHRIIPRRILDLPPGGAINLHASLLPKYRGPSTYKWAIIHGEAQAGATVHVMTPRLDDGDIFAQCVVPIDEDDTGGTLFTKISAAGAVLLAETVERIRSGSAERQPQDESAATYYGYPSNDDARVRWNATAEQIRNLVRGLSPRPGAWTSFASQRVKLWNVAITGGESREAAGSVLAVSPDGVLVATGTRKLLIREMTFGDREPGRADEVAAELGLRPGERFA